ncbi:MAG: aldose 1-epimerase [Clostridia bacterium]|nr:aldose 1-epimerase [Clostridia bacterium]
MEQIVEIKSNQYIAKINVSRGANCICLRNIEYNAHILREPDYTALDSPYLYGMPILYPVNRISGGKFSFEGRVYRFPINEAETDCHLHGTIHNACFTIEQQGGDFLVCRYVSPENDKGFPHKFCIRLFYFLDDKGLLLKTEITNLSEENMPNFLGFHTTFTIPFIKDSKSENIRICADLGEGIARNDFYLPTGAFLTEDVVTKELREGTFPSNEKSISRHYRAARKGVMRICDVEKGVSVFYENESAFGWRMLYSADLSKYICLEPQTCMVNCANSPFDRAYAGFDYIAPHASKTYQSKIYIKEL